MMTQLSFDELLSENPHLSRLTEAGYRGVFMFDTETTGVALGSRIVSYCALMISFDSGTVRLVNELVNPGVRIPVEASEVHGICDFHVKDAPPHETAVDLLHGSIVNAVQNNFAVVAYNAAYDISIVNYFKSFDGLDLVSCTLDPMVLDLIFDKYRRGKRTLTATSQHYGVELKNAHTAFGDVMATLGVLNAILGDYDIDFSIVGIQQEAAYNDRQQYFANRGGDAHPGFPVYTS